MCSLIYRPWNLWEKLNKQNGAHGSKVVVNYAGVLGLIIPPSFTLFHLKVKLTLTAEDHIWHQFSVCNALEDPEVHIYV